MAKEEEANTTRQNLVKGLKKNVLSTFSLTDTIGRAIKVQDQLQQTFVSVGNAQMASLGSLNKTFNNVGLSLKESLGMFGAMADNSLKMSNQSTKDAIARSIKLGKDFQTTSKIIAMNSQALGLSIESSNRMADSFLEAGATYGINSDILVKAISSLSQTLIQSAAVYGPATSKALQEATTELIGRYGAGNAEMVKEMARALFGGTEKSTKMAAMLGLPLNKLATTDSEEMISLFDQALQSLQAKVGGQAGVGTAGLTVPKILEAFGATPAMLQLANLGPLVGEQAALSAKQLEQQVMFGNLMRSLESIARNLTVILMPAVSLLGGIAHVVSLLLGAFNGFGAKALTSLGAILLAVKFVKATGVGIGFGIGPIGIFAALVAGVWGIHEYFTTKDNEVQENILSESQKQTEALYNSGQTKVLGEISARLLEANLFSAQLVLNAEEHLQETKDSRTDKINASPENTNAFAIP